MDRFECNEFRNKFNKYKVNITELIKPYYELHMRVHKVKCFKCDCPDLPLLTNDEELSNIMSDKRSMSLYCKIRERHMKVYHQGGHGYTDCIKSFETTKELTIHKEIHKQSFICDTCGFEAPVSGSLESHKRRVHDSEPKTCPICNLVLKKF